MQEFEYTLILQFEYCFDEPITTCSVYFEVIEMEIQVEIADLLEKSLYLLVEEC